MNLSAEFGADIEVDEWAVMQLCLEFWETFTCKDISVLVTNYDFTNTGDFWSIIVRLQLHFLC